MTFFTKQARLVSLGLLGAILLSLTAWPSSGAVGVAECPISVRVIGSTTVGPIADQIKPQYESLFTNTTQVNSAPWEGSGTGISAIRSGAANVGMSSRPLSPTEAAGLYVYKIASDGFVMGVRNSANMSFIGNITTTQVRAIWESGDDAPSDGVQDALATWADFGLGGPATQITPRSRITSSGSHPDFISAAQFAINSGREALTVAATGLPRLQESHDMAVAAAATDYTIAYTSIANLDVPNLKALTLDNTTANPTTVGNGSYSKIRQLNMMVRENAATPTGTLRIDDSKTVHADDFINNIFGPQGQNAIVATGFVPLGAASSQAIPDWDINMDGSTSLGDLGAITSKWGQSTACTGWIRADANNSGNVSLGDIGVVTGKWGNPGFAAPVYP